MTKRTINKRVLELICHSHSHNCIRLVVHKFGEGVQLQLLQLVFWLLVGLFLGHGLEFLLGLWLFLLGALALEKERYVISWLYVVSGIASRIILSVKFMVLEGGYVPMVG